MPVPKEKDTAQRKPRAPGKAFASQCGEIVSPTQAGRGWILSGSQSRTQLLPVLLPRLNHWEGFPRLIEHLLVVLHILWQRVPQLMWLRVKKWKKQHILSKRLIFQWRILVYFLFESPFTHQKIKCSLFICILIFFFLIFCRNVLNLLHFTSGTAAFHSTPRLTFHGFMVFISSQILPPSFPTKLYVLLKNGISTKFYHLLTGWTFGRCFTTKLPEDAVALQKLSSCKCRMLIPLEFILLRTNYFLFEKNENCPI